MARSLLLAEVAASQPESLKRRNLRGLLPPDELVNEDDLPVNQAFIRAVLDAAKGGLALRRTSRWLNAASFTVGKVLSFTLM